MSDENVELMLRGMGRNTRDPAIQTGATYVWSCEGHRPGMHGSDPRWTSVLGNRSRAERFRPDTPGMRVRRNRTTFHRGSSNRTGLTSLSPIAGTLRSTVVLLDDASDAKNR